VCVLSHGAVSVSSIELIPELPTGFKIRTDAHVVRYIARGFPQMSVFVSEVTPIEFNLSCADILSSFVQVQKSSHVMLV
jgi:hypothetical protein